MKLKLDLHDIYNRGADIDRALRDIIDEAVAKKAPVVEIIPGKGSGQLKKHVLRFLEQKDIEAQVPPAGEGLEELRPPFCPLQMEMMRARSDQDVHQGTSRGTSRMIPAFPGAGHAA